MNNSMTLGKRISIGFAILVVITLILGTIGVVNMRNAAITAAKLSEIYAPEVHVASDIFRVANQARYNIRAFTMRDNETALATAKKEFAELKVFLDEAEALGKKYELKALLEKQSIASKALVEYVGSVERSEKILASKKKSDAIMVEAAPKIVENIESYIASVKQNQVDELKETAVYKDRKI